MPVYIYVVKLLLLFFFWKNVVKLLWFCFLRRLYLYVCVCVFKYPCKHEWEVFMLNWLRAQILSAPKQQHPSWPVLGLFCSQVHSNLELEIVSFVIFSIFISCLSCHDPFRHPLSILYSLLHMCLSPNRYIH